MAVNQTKTEWHPWGPEAFARAKREGKPILLQVLSAAFVADRELELAFQAPGLRQAAEAFVLVRADADERPDLALRYFGAGGSCVFVLQPDGAVFETLSYADPARFALALADCAKVFSPREAPPAEERPVWTGAVAEQDADPPILEDWPRKVLKAVLGRDHSGRACPNCLEMLLYAAGEWADGQAQQELVSRLKALREGPGWDARAGAYSDPACDKVLPLNARLCRIFWEAYSLTGLDAFGNAAEELTSFLLRDLLDENPGAFRHSRTFDDRRAYFADGNAMAALALLKAAAFEDGRKRLEAASRSLVFLSQMCDPGRGMAHCWMGETGRAYGLLADNAWAMKAFCEGYLMSGHRPHRELADSLLRNLLQESWHRERGGFYDRVVGPEDHGLLREAAVVPALNAPAFEAIWKLRELKGNDNYQRWIDWGLRHLAARAGDDVCAAAALVPVYDVARKGRMDLELVGRLGEPSTEAFLAAVQRHYLPRKIISFVDPDDQDYILAHKLKAPTFPRLFGCLDLKPKAMADKPEQVGEVLKALRV